LAAKLMIENASNHTNSPIARMIHLTRYTPCNVITTPLEPYSDIHIPTVYWH